MNPAAPIVAGGLLAASLAAVHATVAPRSRLLGPVISRAPAASPFNTERPAVALTFDDGPAPGSTDAILDILRRESLPAAFFVIGRHVERHPDLAARMDAEGHLLANHTFDHARLAILRGPEYWSDQLRRTSDAIERVTARRPGLFRPPMGFKTPPAMLAAARRRLDVVTWTRRTLDGVSTNPELIFAKAAAARAGEIILLHDGRDPANRRPLGATLAALPRIIAALRAKGLAFVRLDELIARPAYHAAGEGT